MGGNLGLFVSNAAAAATAVTLSGDVTSTAGTAVDVRGGEGDLTFEQRQGLISGNRSGASLSGKSGSVNVRIGGEIRAERDFGLFVNSGASGDKMSVELTPETSIRSASTGSSPVVRLYHSGSGQQSIRADGAITAGGPNNYGIEVLNAASAETLLFSQANTGSVKAASTGILVLNSGGGATEMDAHGTVESTKGYGIFVDNGVRTTDLIVRASGKVDSALAGVVGRQRGSGATDIAVSGDVTSTTSVGLQVEHAGQQGLSVKQTAGTITGHVLGINVNNRGPADTSVSLGGDVVGSVQVFNRGNGNIRFTQESGSINRTLAAGNVAINDAGGTVDFLDGAGLHVVNFSHGSTTIELAGDVTASLAGVAARNTVAASSLIVVQKSGVIESAGTAINLGLAGDIALDINGIVKGGSGSAIDILAPINAAVDIRANAIVSATSGTAIHNPDVIIGGRPFGGDLVVRSSGTVTGDSNLLGGNDRFELLGGRYNGNIYGDYGDHRDTTDRVDTDIPAGDDTFIWSDGTLVGGFYGGQGSDRAEISAAGYDGTQTLDGGDDTSIADGMIDTLRFSGIAATSTGDKIINWEDVRLDASNLNISNGAWAVGTVDQPETGIALSNNSTLNGMTGLRLTSNLVIDNTSSFVGQGGGQGHFAIAGTVSNAGTITTQDGRTGDRVEIVGNYVGDGGRLALDTVLADDSSSTDQLKISGDVTGNTLVSVRNTGGGGAQTQNGIRIIEVGGNSASDAFELDGSFQFNGRPAVVSGAYAYQLRQGTVDGSSMQDWYLRSEVKDSPTSVPNQEPQRLFQPGVSVYEAYPKVLLGMNGLQTLQQRVGASEQDLVEKADRLVGFWTRIEGSHTRMNPFSSATEVSYRQSYEKLQTGVAGQALDTDRGQLLAGAAVHYVQGDASTTSLHDGDLGGGRILTDGYGFSGSLTWYDDHGFYVDAQGQATWYRSDLSYNGDTSKLADSVDAFGYAFSVEAGHEIPLSRAWTLVPQAQLIYSSASIDGFTDVFETPVGFGKSESIQSRLGLGINHDLTWQGVDGLTSRLRLHGTADVHYAVADRARVSVADIPVAQRNDRLLAGLTADGSYSWDNDRFSLYGGAEIKGSVENVADSHSLKGYTGFRLTW
ncbi:autotransporter outer membrane beta-barrel domain-containing protein [Ochrobactrum sp. AN78]|uniref:autotransporter family protein n=1 Tax=Ochrobactrum sp. AN78 TaxID=3039853 RepID=UPI002989C3B2|nr:autotransporter outer membrane beta-barrel domain-containing protein [Ochrobactrum sp. AN78]